MQNRKKELVVPKKRFGQNFLIDNNIINNIVNSAKLTKDDLVIEIGPGLGAITRGLCEDAGYVLAYEIDYSILPYLNENVKDYQNIKIINQDILKSDLKTDIENLGFKYKRISVVANLPYYITTPIILKLLESGINIKEYIIMIQLEVAERICGKPKTKEYNNLSILIGYKAKATKLFNVMRGSFNPAPNVDSAVIKLEVYDKIPFKANDEELFYKLIRQAFEKRRKTLYNNLITYYDKDKIHNMYDEFNLNASIRSEALSIKDFVDIANYLSTDDKLSVFAHSKVNLALEVMDEVDGYHKVNNLMIPITLYDKLTFEISDTITLVDNKIEDNIIIKAAKLFLSHFKIDGGVKIEIEKNIPVSAGLAGGSTDAAATLKGLNKLYNVNASDDELMALASTLGSDVPFFIKEEASLCTNRGEVINPLGFNPKPIRLLLIKVKSGNSTKEVYQNYTYEGVDRKDNIENIIKALKSNDIKLLKNNIFNDLTKPALKLNKELKTLYSILSKNHDIYLSGSGPTMFIVDPTNKEVEKLKEKYNDLFIFDCYTK